MANRDEPAQPRPASGEPSAERVDGPPLEDDDVQVALIGDMPDGATQSGAAQVQRDQDDRSAP